MNRNVMRKKEILKLFYKNNSSIISTIRACRRLHWHPVPYALEIRRIISKFENEGTVINKKKTGRVPWKINRERVRMVENVCKGQWISTYDVAELCDISQPSAHRVMRKKLHFIPYKSIKAQKLIPADPEIRVSLCSDFLDLWYNSQITNFVFIDECTVYTDGKVTSNYRCWDNKPPADDTRLTVRNQAAQHCNIFVAMNSEGIIDSYIFHNNTVRGDELLEYYQASLIPALNRRFNNNLLDVHFFQDSAPLTESEK